jgi:hypothetical protein
VYIPGGGPSVCGEPDGDSRDGTADADAHPARDPAGTAPPPAHVCLSPVRELATTSKCGKGRGARPRRLTGWLSGPIPAGRRHPTPRPAGGPPRRQRRADHSGRPPETAQRDARGLRDASGAPRGDPVTTLAQQTRLNAFRDANLDWAIKWRTWPRIPPGRLLRCCSARCSPRGRCCGCSPGGVEPVRSLPTLSGPAPRIR